MAVAESRSIAPPIRMATMVRQSFHAMSPHEKVRVVGMYSVVALLHVVGFLGFLIFVVPSHYKGLGFGVAFTAYTLGLRHAFDADHISAIDNTTRKMINERRLDPDKPRPFAFGLLSESDSSSPRRRSFGRFRTTARAWSSSGVCSGRSSRHRSCFSSGFST
jgi:hypothetical protein